MAVARVIEIKASSATSLGDAVKQGVARASKTLKNAGAAWIETREAVVDDKGDVAEYRGQLRIACILEGQAEY